MYSVEVEALIAKYQDFIERFLGQKSKQEIVCN